MRDYQKTKIFRLFSTSNPSLSFVGFTTKETVFQRLTTMTHIHKKHIRNPDKIPKRRYMKVLDTRNYQIEELEAFPCDSKDEAVARAKWWRAKLN